MEPSPTDAPSAPHDTTARKAMQLGLEGPVLAAFALGIGLLVLAGLFLTILTTSDDPSAGLADAATWIAWLGGVTLSLALVVAGLRSGAPIGARTALVLVGTYLFMQANAGSFGLLARFL